MNWKPITMCSKFFRSTSKRSLKLAARLIFAISVVLLLCNACGPSTPDAKSLEQLNDRLHTGVKTANWEVVDSCLRRGADINAYNKQGTPTVIFAAQSGNPIFLERLVKAGLDVTLKRKSYYGSTALMETGAVNDTVIGAVLLEHGANVNVIDTFGDPAINWAAYYGHVEYVDLLVRNGASMGISSKNGDVLDVALKQWQDDLVEYLIDAGAGTPIARESGKALVEAVKANDLDQVTAQLTSGADPNQVDEAKSPVLTIAASRGYGLMVDLLLEKGATVDQYNRVGQTALARAAYFGHYEIARKLISAGASVNDAGEQYNLTPLISAANGGQAEVGRLLIDFGAQLDAQDALNGFTPIMFATAYGHKDFVKLLIESKANPFIKSFDGAGLYDMVSFSNNEEIHEMLQQYLMQEE